MMTRCRRCGKDLSKVDLIRAMEGMLFCSDTCALIHISTQKSFDNTARVKEYYNEVVELITPQDIGLCDDAPLNPVVKILMKRDGMSKQEAQELVASVRETVEQCSGSFEAASDVLADELGLEMDYIFDVLG